MVLRKTIKFQIVKKHSELTNRWLENAEFWMGKHLRCFIVDRLGGAENRLGGRGGVVWKTWNFFNGPLKFEKTLGWSKKKESPGKILKY